MDIAEFKDPIEVWKAVEGDPSDLIALLRSNTPIYRVDRDALADWLEGILKPVKHKRGRAPKDEAASIAMRHVIEHYFYGYDPDTQIGFAAWRCEKCWRYIKKRRWNNKKTGYGLTLIWLQEAIAKKYCDEDQLETLINHMKRSKPKKPKLPVYGPEASERRRREIARKVQANKKKKTARK